MLVFLKVDETERASWGLIRRRRRRMGVARVILASIVLAPLMAAFYSSEREQLGSEKCFQ